MVFDIIKLSFIMKHVVVLSTELQSRFAIIVSVLMLPKDEVFLTDVAGNFSAPRIIIKQINVTIRNFNSICKELQSKISKKYKTIEIYNQ